jgi:type II secretory ATPase GspE/PulE/Tfp pilus assembly ATPase PilB-like protein
VVLRLLPEYQVFKLDPLGMSEDVRGRFQKLIEQPHVRQVQVSPQIGLTFDRALRAFLRCDPDVIMIGEIRDRETADAAIEASLTGHLVLSTLHTNSALETATRLLEMGLDPFTFGNSLLGVLAQRLVQKRARADEIAEAAREKGMATLRQDGLRKVLQGLTDVKEVLSMTVEEDL